MKDFKKVINELKNVKVNNVAIAHVRNVNVTDMTTWQRVALTLDVPVKGFVADDEGNYKEGETKQSSTLPQIMSRITFKKQNMKDINYRL